MLSIAFLCVAFLAGVILLKGTGNNDLKPAKICAEAEDNGIDSLLIAKRGTGDMPDDRIGVVYGKPETNRQSGGFSEETANGVAAEAPRPGLSDDDPSQGYAEAENAQDDPGDGVLNGGAGGTTLIGEGGAGQRATETARAAVAAQRKGDDTLDRLNGQAVDPGDLTEFDLSEDALVFVKDPGTPDPILRLTINRDRTQTLTADDQVVAVIDDIDVCVSDIVIVERGALKVTV